MTFFLPSSIMFPSSSCPPHRHINLAVIMWVVPHSFCPNSLSFPLRPNSLSSDLPEAAWALGSTQEVCVLPIDPFHRKSWHDCRLAPLYHQDSLLPGLPDLFSTCRSSVSLKEACSMSSMSCSSQDFSWGAICSVDWSGNLGSLGILREKQAAGLKVGLGLGLGEWSKLKVSRASSGSFI